MLTVEQLTASAEFHCEIVAGATGGGRVISWAHTSELVDPTPWLSGGELVMSTGLALAESPEEQVAYLERLAKRGVAGLALGDRRLLGELDLHDVTRQFWDAADSLELPVVLVSGSTPFIAIAQYVSLMSADAAHHRMARHLRLYESLARIANEELRLSDCIQMLSEVSGYDLFVLSPAGQPLFDDLPQPSVPVEIADVAEALKTEDFAARVPRPLSGSNDDQRVFMLPILAQMRRVGIIVAVARDDDDDRLVLHHIVTIVSFLAADLLRERERERREGTELLARVLHEAEQQERTMAALFPESIDDRFAFAATTMPDSLTAWDEFHHRLVEHGFPYRLTRRSDRGVIVVALGDREPADFEQVIRSHLGGAAIGISSVVGQQMDVLEARRQARWSLRGAIIDDESVQHYKESDRPRWLLRDTSGLELLVDEILGPLLTHDQGTGSELERTVRVFLEHNRSWKTASEELFIHRQTLIHRVKRIEELTERRLDNTSDVCDFWLALRARRALELPCENEV